jgi:hypothetical protein
MPQVVIENPVINSPFGEPTRHFRFTDEGITNEIIEARRVSQYFVPIARPKKKGAKQLQFDTEWTQDRIEENKLVNQIRARVRIWREGGYVGITPTTAGLLAYWTDPNRERKLFFCQIEALETAIYITEAARKFDAWIENSLRDANNTSNPGLPRTAMKMATGSGKTVVMAMLIAWQTLIFSSAARCFVGLPSLGGAAVFCHLARHIATAIPWLYGTSSVRADATDWIPSPPQVGDWSETSNWCAQRTRQALSVFRRIAKQSI